MATTTNRTDKILVVDDDARIRDLLRRYLTQEGFEVMVAEDGKALNRLLLRETVDLIVLDLMMPGEDGLSICRRLRAANDRTPIIMLTAKGEDVDRIVGLEVGADDYLGKPFNPRELLARVHAVLRRRPAQEAPGAPSGDNEVVTFGPFTFDLGTRALQRNGEELPLTTDEFAMPDVAAGKGLPQLVVVAAERLAGLEDARVVAERLLARVAGVADEGRVDVFDFRFGIGDDDAVRALLDGQRQLAQLFLGQVPFGDILHRADRRHRLPGIVKTDVGPFAHPANIVTDRDAMFVIVGFAVQGGLPVGHHPFAIFGMNA